VYNANQEIMILRKDEYIEYDDLGYFVNVQFDMSQSSSVYTISMSTEAYNQLIKNVKAMNGDNEMKSEIKLLLTDSQFDKYKNVGYFKNVVYSWTYANGFHSIIIEPDSYQQYYRNRRGTQ